MPEAGMQETARQLAKRLDEGLAGQIRRPTVTEALQQEKVGLEARLAMVNEAIAAMESHPEVTQVLDLLAKVGVRP